MRFFPRYTGIFVLLALLISPALLAAQDESAEITVVGSGIVEPAFRALAEASEVDAPVSISVTGTNTGFSNFCAGEADITLANRAISTNENDTCATNEVGYVELLIGHDILALVAHPEAEFATCLDAEQLNTLFAPSVQGQITNWNQVFEEGPDVPLALFLPGENSAAYAILDSQIEGDGLRVDVINTSQASEVITGVGEDSGALGVVSLPEALAAGDAVQIIELNASSLPGCQAPTAETVEDNLYPTANKLYAYVNVASLSESGLADLLNFIISDEALTAVEELGFVAPTDSTVQANRDALAAGISGQPIPRAADDFTLPSGVVGQVSVGGAAGGFGYIEAITADFNTVNPEVTTNLNIEGEPAGFRRLCNGEIDFAIAYRDLNDEEAANCASNEVETLTIPLGQQAVVLLANAETDFLTCLTLADITTAWSAASDSTVTSWEQVNPAFAETPITLFAPSVSSADADLMLTQASGSALATRADVELHGDPLYRAAATANVQGALTYMNWFEYQEVLDNNQAGVTLVGVDGGEGCVTPDQQTITNGSYPLARSLQVIANREELARAEVQALLWYMLSDENYPLLEANNIVGPRFGELPALRATLQTAFDEAEVQAAAEAAAEATEEATEEATSEATEEAVGTAEAEATEEAGE